MKKLASAIMLSLSFIAGGVTGGCACYLYFDHVAYVADENDRAGEFDESLSISNSKRSALYHRANLFRQKCGQWPTNIPELVRAGFLPEFSNVYLSPWQAEYGRFEMPYDQEGNFIDKNHEGAVGYYRSSAYRFEFDGTNFTVR